MSQTFRELVKKIGSGVHTGEDLTREEAKLATELILTQQATPAQIGAFMIAHRIKRPTASELAGMLDAYAELGPKLNTDNLPFSYPVAILGSPYDGRSRTAPVTVITALILASAGVPVVMHGGDCMPTKYGIPLAEIWQELGVDFTGLSLEKIEEVLSNTGIGFIYLPKHFPQAHQIVTYRAEIGKRPPFATIELIWAPCSANFHVLAGFVHPPTENLFRETFKLLGIDNFTTIKGLEGSCDLALSRTGIIGLGEERLLLHPRDYGFEAKDIPLETKSELRAQLKEIITGNSNQLLSAVIFNGGFYLWRLGISPTIEEGLSLTKEMLREGKVKDKLEELKK